MGPLISGKSRLVKYDEPFGQTSWWYQLRPGDSGGPEVLNREVRQVNKEGITSKHVTTCEKKHLKYMKEEGFQAVSSI